MEKEKWENRNTGQQDVNKLFSENLTRDLKILQVAINRLFDFGTFQNAILLPISLWFHSLQVSNQS